MKSLCIKTNNSEIIYYLLEKFENFNMENVCYSQNTFRNYKNVIIHYKGTEDTEFIYQLSELLTECIIHFYEENILSHIIRYNYFYFDKKEQQTILSTIHSLILDNEKYLARDSYIWSEILSYILSNHSIILSGFVNFRLKTYTDLLNQIVDEAVSKYIIDREYSEFINLLKIYITNQKTSIPFIHLIYTNNESILLDGDHNPLPASNNSIKAKYLSDITFSSNDYALNTLLNLIPERLEVHLIDEKEDEFINTLKSIFEDRIHVCHDCSICSTYKRFCHVTI